MVLNAEAEAYYQLLLSQLELGSESSDDLTDPCQQLQTQKEHMSGSSTSMAIISLVSVPEPC